MKTTRNIVMTDSEAQGLQSTAVGGKRIGEKYINDLTTQARGVQSFAAGASCEADGEASIAMGIRAKAYQHGSISIGNTCSSGLTQSKFNEKFATDEQKALVGYDETKLNGGLSIQILDNDYKTYDISESFSFTTGVGNNAWGHGAFVSGSQNNSYAGDSFIYGNNNTNNGRR